MIIGRIYTSICSINDSFTIPKTKFASLILVEWLNQWLTTETETRRVWLLTNHLTTSGNIYITL